MKSFLRRILPVFLILLVIAGIYAASTHKSIYRFDGWEGPSEASSLPANSRTSIAAYAQGGASRLAILVTDPDSDWLGLAHGLKTIGVPFVITEHYQEALEHKVVMVYPTISGRLLNKEALQALAAHPRNGGTLIGFEVLGGGLNETFGFTETSATREHTLLKLDDELAKTFLSEPSIEASIPLAGSSGNVPAQSFMSSTGQAVAHYENGQTAMVRRSVGAGTTYAIGIDIGAYIAKAYNGRQQLGRSYVNAYEPAVDTLLRLIRHIYRSSEPLAVTLGTVPDGKSVSVVITHDIDYTRSIVNAVEYADYEQSQGIAATYFVQTKYVRDWNDDIFFNEQGTALMRKLADKGMEIASHSVSHSLSFARFPIGSGKEHYPDYVPFVKSKTETKDGTILGELRVSRYLLEKAVPGASVASFRPGHLEYPFSLPEAMQSTGYRFSSSISSGTALTHLPFKLNYRRENHAETGIFEFPITIEDELQRPMTGRLDQAVRILQQLKTYGGVCVVLIHPDVFDDKMAFLKEFVTRAKAMNAWFGTLSQLGSWWTARDAVSLDVKKEGQRFVVELNAKQKINGLVLQVPTGWHLASSSAGESQVRQNGNTVLLQELSGPMTLRFE